MGRAVLGIVVGVVVAVLVILAMEAIGHRVFSPPPGVNPRDPAAMRTIVAQMPAAAFALIVFGWVLGAGIGAWVATRLSRTHRAWPGVIVAAATLGATIVNVTTIPHPTWVVTAAVIGIPLAAWVGMRAGRTPPAGAAAPRAA